MAPERVILCGGVTAGKLRMESTPLQLNCYGPEPNVHLHLDAIRRTLWKPIPLVLRDLIDVAAYVYAADQSFTRAHGGRLEGDEIGAGWRRNFRFRIPVRLPDLWNSTAIQKALTETLSFQTEDSYLFEFSLLAKDTSLDGFISYDETPCDGIIEEVVMFSGGLDSLAGAIEESIVTRRQVLLVNHRSNNKLVPRHNRLLRRLQDHAGDRAPLHFPVRINKKKCLNKEYTQRSRSFLFTALGTTFARMIGLSRLRFFENGIISFNLPLTAEVLGARASRTTHPRVLAGYETLVTELVGERFTIQNPFLWDTKADVVDRIRDSGCSDLIGLSTSCAHTWELTSRTHSHCGGCSQCIDRRFAVLASGVAEHDSSEAYVLDLLTSDRQSPEAKAILTAYVELVERVELMGQQDFLQHFSEVARVLPYLDGPASVEFPRLFELYRKHARQVTGVIDAAIARYCNAVRRRILPTGCLLRIAFDDRPTDAPTIRLEPPPDGNYFLRRGKGWAIRFEEGEENFLPDEKGLNYLRLLLENPNRIFTASELAARLTQLGAQRPNRAISLSEAAAVGASFTNGHHCDPILDQEAVEALRSRLREIQENRELLQACDLPNRLEALDELEAQHRVISSQLRTHRRHGRSRELDPNRDRVRNRVCNAIRRAIRTIRGYDQPLAHHLSRPILNLGHSLSYVPRTEVIWSLNDWSPN